MNNRLMQITPEMAREWLDKNSDNNRKINREVVSRFASDIANGRWKITHQGIAFDVRGRLVDGQHRLSAIVAAGTPCTMYVATGLEEGSIHTIDTGKIRTSSDAMRMLHPDDTMYRNAIVIGTARIMIETSSNGQALRGKTIRISNSEVSDYITKYYHVFKWLHIATSNHRSGLGRGCATTFAIICALSNYVDESMIKAYMECLYENQIGTAVSVNWKAALDYRTYLETLRRNKSSSRTSETVFACKKSIYLFANNISKTSKTSLYEFSEAKLEMLNDMLKETM